MRRGTLIRVHRGVYRVGHRAPCVEARYLAAVWACGEGALLCGLAAGYLLVLLMGGVAPPAEVVARGERRIEGVRVRRSRGLVERDAFVWRGVPVTSVARTMVDSGLGALRQCSGSSLPRGRDPSTGRCRKHVEAGPDAVPQESRARRICARSSTATNPSCSASSSGASGQLLRSRPAPPDHEPARGRAADRLPLARPSPHRRARRLPLSPLAHAWERDRRREREARARGDDFRRFTFGDVDQPLAMLAELRSVLTYCRSATASQD